jgi:ribosomal-protein-alanine N-acetyltransferase
MYPPSYLRTSRTVIRLLRVDEAALLLRYRIENRVHLEPWEPAREPAHYTLGGCQDAIVAALEAVRGDRAYPFAVLSSGEEEMVASVTLANVVRGIFQACHLGYGIALRHQGQGLMREALDAVVAHAFGALGFHRLMANYMPHNERSGRLLERLGFEREGQAKRYLKIAGVWEDHVLTARINSRG